ncbi:MULTISPECIES: DUF3331 domain-containing protein [Burkholderia]|uniref:DUF3331 domain-containing protein n=1 Tax=Burkholderia TaxID=32008 RepID=UPI000B26FA61|nr:MULTISPECIES: DUF3331 domain-containing protein [Burkholderia]
MEQYVTDDTAWQRAVSLLDAGHADQLTARVRHLVGSHGEHRLSTGRGAVVIALLDRISPRAATVSWSDPQDCKYGEQVWRLVTAKQSGICALSGQPVAAGDAIFRPAKVKPPPANAAAMMLAVAVDRAFADQRC